MGAKTMLGGVVLGFLAWFIIRFVFTGFYIVNQNQRAVKTVFGRAQRVENKTTLDDPISELLREDEQARYAYPQVRVIQPGGPYFKWPWEKVYKVSVATETVNMAFDPEDRRANSNNTILEAVTKDNINIKSYGLECVEYAVTKRRKKTDTENNEHNIYFMCLINWSVFLSKLKKYGLSLLSSTNRYGGSS
jgi:uncharacterized membrane protein YqiK